MVTPKTFFFHPMFFIFFLSRFLPFPSLFEKGGGEENNQEKKKKQIQKKKNRVPFVEAKEAE